MRRLVAFALLCFVSTPLCAQAFGVNMGDPIGKYSGKATDNKNQYRITVPLPNKEFEFYLAVATPSTGICKVSGVGHNHENDDYGTRVRAAFEDLRSALGAKYGNSKS